MGLEEMQCTVGSELAAASKSQPTTLTRSLREGSILAHTCPWGGGGGSQQGHAERGSHKNSVVLSGWFAKKQTPLRWLFSRDIVQAPGRPGSRVRPLLLLFCFWEGPGPPHCSPPTPHMWEPQPCRAFSAELSRIHPEGQGPGKGPVHHKRSCTHFPE